MLPSALSLTWISSLIPNGTKRFFVRLPGNDADGKESP